MFKLQTGNPLNTPNPTSISYQCVAAAAMHELQSQIVKDVTILLAHQNAVGKCCSEQTDTNITIDHVKKLTDIVLKFHIFGEQGLCKSLDPLVESITTGNPVVSNDPLIQQILVKSDRYRKDVFNRNFSNVALQITKVSQMSQSEYSENIKASFANNPNHVEVLTYEDGTVQCNCNYCKRFFNILKKMPENDCTPLNPLQVILAKNYHMT